MLVGKNILRCDNCTNTEIAAENGNIWYIAVECGWQIGLIDACPICRQKYPQKIVTNKKNNT